MPYQDGNTVKTVSNVYTESMHCAQQAVAEGGGPDTPDRTQSSPSNALQPPSITDSDGTAESLMDPNSAAASELGLAEPHSPRHPHNGELVGY